MKKPLKHTKRLKDEILTSRDKVLYSTIRRFNKDMDWLKLNHPDVWVKYNKLLTMKKKSV